MALVVLVTERLSEGLRGAISKWLVEVGPGTYVGTLSARVREELWAQVAEWTANDQLGYALLVHPAPTEQGFRIDAQGDSTYAVRDRDGIDLVERHHKRRDDSEGGDFPVPW